MGLPITNHGALFQDSIVIIRINLFMSQMKEWSSFNLCHYQTEQHIYLDINDWKLIGKNY